MEALRWRGHWKRRLNVDLRGRRVDARTELAFTTKLCLLYTSLLYPAWVKESIVCWITQRIKKWQ